MTKKELEQLRNAVADYMWSEGCSCCQDREKHEEARKRLGDLLLVGSVGDYHDFTSYRSAVRVRDEVSE